MPRISLPLTRLRPHYDVLVVGSGYGGAIAANRMARADKRVCLLERGRELLPGDFPDTLEEAAAELQIHGPLGSKGSRTGLLDFRVNDELSVFQGCGLGGTSLVNAGVALEPEPWVFQDPRWPDALRADVANGLAQGFQRARDMLRPEGYPQDRPLRPKGASLEASAAAVGGVFKRTPINVNFRPGPNHLGITQPACNDCGDCVSGCNTGAKNTLAMNYLPDAARNGAELFTQATVRWLARGQDGKWHVHFQALHTGREAFDAPLLEVTADVVILAAGVLGTAGILMRSRQRGLALSAQLGERFSGNGDVLALAYNCDTPINSVGRLRNASPQSAPGPCITGVIDLRTGNGERGMVIEEGSIPSPLSTLLPAALAAAALGGHDTDSSVTDTVAERARTLESKMRGPYHGAVLHSQVYLVMSHDSAEGRLYLQDGQVRINWPGVGEQPVFKAINDTLRKATAAHGGTFIPNPLWENLLGKQHDLVTVHPLGGCCMGDSATHGVVDHKGRVFTGVGTQVHEGLYVSDGAILPRPLGVNPLLTISALSERICACLAQDRGWTIDYTRRPAVPVPSAAAAVGIQFTETMRGHVSREEEDFAQAAAAGRRANNRLDFTLTILFPDLDAMLADPTHEGALVGTVDAAGLSQQPLQVRQGHFRLLESAEGGKARRMVYRLPMHASDGSVYFLDGYKHIRSDRHGLDLWADTTTLYITVHAGIDSQGPIIGRGVLRIAPDDFMRQLTTLRTPNATGTARLEAVARFGRFFAGELWDVFGPLGQLRPTTLNEAVMNDEAFFPHKPRPLHAPTPTVHAFHTPDGTALRLTRYHAGDKGPVLLVHGLGVSSEIFSTDTIDTNLVEYLCEHSYDVWNLDFRASILLPASGTVFDGDVIAQQDLPVAVAEVRRISGAASVQAVVHCFGATTWFMAMLGGMQGVRSFVCSQIATDYMGSCETQLKTGLYLPDALSALGVDSLTAYAGEHPDWQARLLDHALVLYPLPFSEWCEQPICRRIAFMYAPLYEHRNLTVATHERLHELFGIANLRCFEHIARIGRAGKLVGADGSDRYMPHLDRLRLPIAFLHGGNNRCFDPASTARTYETLRHRFGAEGYSRHVIDGYGHIDCIFGKNADRDVFPYIVRHLDAHA